MSEPIRILHMIGSLNVGGSQALVLNLYRKIDRSKIQFDFIIDHREHLYYKDEVEKMGARVYRFPSFNGYNYWEIKKTWKDFFENHKEYKILHSHIRSYASMYLPVAKQYGLKTIIHSHSVSNGIGLRSFVKSVLQFPLRFQADYFMACSIEAGKWLFGNKVAHGDCFILIRNSIDSDRFTFNNESRSITRTRLSLENKFVIGNVGRLVKSKNHVFLIEIFEKVLEQAGNAMLLIVGDGEEKQHLIELVKIKGISERVIFAGNRDDTELYYNAMDVFVFPSMWEGLGIVAIEAQASGLPCVIEKKIPKEADLNVGLINRLGLEEDAGIWAKEVLRLKNTERISRKDAVREAGYDIEENVTILQRFYLNLHS